MSPIRCEETMTAGVKETEVARDEIKKGRRYLFSKTIHVAGRCRPWHQRQRRRDQDARQRDREAGNVTAEAVKQTDAWPLLNSIPGIGKVLATIIPLEIRPRRWSKNWQGRVITC